MIRVDRSKTSLYIYIYMLLRTNGCLLDVYISKEMRSVILLPIKGEKLLLTIPENNMNYLLPYVATVHDSLLQRLLANNIYIYVIYTYI